MSTTESQHNFLMALGPIQTREILEQEHREIARHFCDVWVSFLHSCAFAAGTDLHYFFG